MSTHYVKTEHDRIRTVIGDDECLAPTRCQGEPDVEVVGQAATGEGVLRSAIVFTFLGALVLVALLLYSWKSNRLAARAFQKVIDAVEYSPVIAIPRYDPRILIGNAPRLPAFAENRLQTAFLVGIGECF